MELKEASVENKSRFLEIENYLMANYLHLSRNEFIKTYTSVVKTVGHHSNQEWNTRFINWLIYIIIHNLWDREEHLLVMNQRIKKEIEYTIVDLFLANNPKKIIDIVSSEPFRLDFFYGYPVFAVLDEILPFNEIIPVFSVSDETVQEDCDCTSILLMSKNCDILARIAGVRVEV